MTVKTPILPSNIKPGTSIPVSVKSNSNIIKIAIPAGQQIVQTSSAHTSTTAATIKTQRVILPSPAPSMNLSQNDSLIQTKIVPMADSKVKYTSDLVVMVGVVLSQ